MTPKINLIKIHRYLHLEVVPQLNLLIDQQELIENLLKFLLIRLPHLLRDIIFYKVN